jgi:fructokinase
MFNLIGLGEILWDLLPAGRQLGGAPANFACHANALGANAAIISRVGTDQNGADLLSRARQLSLSIDLIQIDSDLPTGTVSVELTPDGQPRYIIHENVAWDRISATKEVLLAAANAAALCFGTLAQRSEKSRAAIHEILSHSNPDALRILDVNLRQNYYSAQLLDQSLRAANILKVNDAEIPILAQLLALSGDPQAQIVQIADRYQLRLVACTRGAHGSLLYSNGRSSEHPGISTNVADTIGAGDSFTAAMTLGILAGWDLDKINEQANRVASFVASRPGATPDLPSELREPFTASTIHL